MNSQVFNRLIRVKLHNRVAGRKGTQNNFVFSAKSFEHICRIIKLSDRYKFTVLNHQYWI